MSEALGARQDKRAELLKRLLERERSQRESAASSITPRADSQAPVPLSFAQERLWFLDRLGQVGPAYNVTLGLKLEGSLDAQALERSFGELISRHESLRTHFEERGGVACQIVREAEPFQLAREDLTVLT